MVYKAHAARLAEIGEDAFSLFQKVTAEHSQRLAAPFAQTEKFEDMALRHAMAAEQLEAIYTPEILSVAKGLSALCDKGWERHSPTLEFFGVLAHTAALLGQHPRSEDVGTLILRKDAEPVAIGSNRVPENIPLFGAFYADGMRKAHIVCAERIAVARHLGIFANPPPMELPDYPALVKASIARVTRDLHEASGKGPQLEEHYVLTTSMPCKTCAAVLMAHKPMGVIAPNGINRRFKCAEESLTVRQEFDASGIPFIPLPMPLKGLCV